MTRSGRRAFFQAQVLESINEKIKLESISRVQTARRKSKAGTRRCFHVRFRSAPGRARDHCNLRSRRDSQFRKDTKNRNLDVCDF